MLEDTAVTPEQLAAEFGQEILELVQGVTKLDKLQFTNREDAQAENFRKFFMAMAKDLRVIIINSRTDCIICALSASFRPKNSSA